MTRKAKELREKQRKIQAQARDLLDGAEEENRDFTADEQRQWDEMQGEMEALGRRAQRLEDEERERRAANPPPWAGERDEPAKSSQIVFRDLSTGREVRGVRDDDRLADQVRADSDWRGLSFGRFVCGSLFGNWVGAEDERRAAETTRAMSVGSDAAGGYMVPEPLAATFIDLARAQTVIGRAGATFVPMETATLALARNAGDPTAGWKSENAAGTSSDMTLERVTLTARTLFANVKLSQELYEDAGNLPMVLENALARALAVELDRVALVGSGVAPEPQGIYGASNVNTYTLADTVSNYDFVSRAVQAVREDNHEPTAMVAHPRTFGELDRLKDSQLQPLRAPESYSALRRFPTTNIPVDVESGGSPNDDTIAIVGDFRELLIGTRLQVSVEASKQAADGSDNAWLKYQTWVRAVARMDVQIMRPAAFCNVLQIERTA